MAQKSYCHRGGTVPLLGVTIPAHFQCIADRYPEREAVVSMPQNRRLTYGALAKQIDHLALGLLGMGFAKGDRIGVWSSNNLEWLLLQMATARIGAILVNINPAYRTRELSYALKRSEVQGLFLIPAFRGADYVAMLAELVPELKQDGGWKSGEFPHLGRVVVFDPANPPATARPHPGFTLWG